MIEDIIENNTQTNILTFFLASPERSFFEGELEKRIGGKHLQKELAALVKIKALNSFTKKGKKYFRINRKHPEYAVLKTEVQKFTKKYEDELYKNLKKIPGLRLGVLTGIFVGEPQMDCDILLVGDIKEKPIENFIAGVQNMIGQEVNYVVMNEKEFEYRRNIFDRFMKTILENYHLLAFSKMKV